MTTLKLAAHNQGDVARSPLAGWDVECLSERSPKRPPRWAMRHTSRRLKGLAIDWDPDVLDVKHERSALSHLGIPKVTPNRGRLWVEGSLVTAPWIDIAVVCSHRVNDNDGSDHPVTAFVRRHLWNHSARGDRRLFKRLERRGFLVLYGGDINDRTADLTPLVRELRGHYDAIGYSRDKRLSLVGKPASDGRLGSDHERFTATFDFKH